jgi:hypothetical protein
MYSPPQGNPCRNFGRNNSRKPRPTGFPEGRAHYKDKEKKPFVDENEKIYAALASLLKVSSRGGL